MAAAPASALPYLHSNLCQAVSLHQPRRRDYAALLESLTEAGWTDLCRDADPLEAQKLLRYAVLAPSKIVRDEILHQANRLGLGTTILYQTTLPEVDGMPAIFPPHTRYPNAEDFAQRLLTLPVHSDTSRTAVLKIGEIIRRYSCS